MFAAAVPLVSWNAMTSNAIEKSPILKKIPVWAIYSSDDRSIDFAREEFERVEKAGCNVKKSEFGICGHNAWTPAMLQADIFAWMLSRSKKDGEYVAVYDPGVNPDALKGIIDVASRDTSKPVLAPAIGQQEPANVPAAQAVQRVAPVEQPLRPVQVPRETDAEDEEGILSAVKIIEECDRPWAMTTESLYGLFAADWGNEGKSIPDFIVKSTSDELSRKLARSVGEDAAATEFVEACKSILLLQHKPMSSPWFETGGGRQRSDIKYSLSAKGQMFVRFLRTVKDSGGNSPKALELSKIASRTLEKIDLVLAKD
jgi:hypothetical protein